MAIIVDEKNKNKKVILLVAVAVIIIALLGAAFYLFYAFDMSFISFDMFAGEKQLPEDRLKPYVEGNFLANLEANEKMLEDTKLKSLRQFVSLPINVGKTGRQNPFVSP